jgi:diguanylate cyclase (GGDEF)-like protein
LAAKRHEFVATIRDITEQKHTEEQLEKLNAELSAISLTDALTGVANRRHFDDMLHKEWNRAMRSASPLCLLMIDIDHFKTFNDQYGHLAGDSCLRDVAQLVQASVLRAGDVVCRYGGEEFAVILPETVAEKAALVATRIMDGLQHLAREHQASPLGIVTVSIGIASSVPPLGGEPSALVLAADTALYRAKHAGRARAEIATQVPLQARPHDEALVEKPEADVASV